MSDIPENVIRALAYAREDGSYNMLDSRGVIDTIEGANDQEGFEDAVGWLMDNKKRYMEALTAMGEFVAAQKEAKP